MKPSAWILNTSVPSFVVAVVAVSILVTGDRLTIKECEPNGRVSISENGNSSLTFTCGDLYANETVGWFVRMHNVVTLAFACGPPSQACDTHNPYVNISRTVPSSSTFIVDRNYWKELGYDTVLCSSFQNSSNFYRCNISVIPHPASTTVQTHLPITSGIQKNLEMAPAKDPFPSAAVGGSVAAVVVAVIVGVVAVVFYKRRSQESGKIRKQTADTGVYDNSAVTDASANEASAKGPYASLDMSDVGLRSVYSDLTHSSPATQSAQPGDYASLQMSDVGMKSTYSVLGQHVGVAKANDGTDYEIPP